MLLCGCAAGRGDLTGCKAYGVTRNRTPARHSLIAGVEEQEASPMATVSVRYIVDDVDAALTFYCQHLGFTEQMHPAPTFAMLTRGDLRLLLSAPGGGPGGGQAMPDGTLPAPGGWNRFSIEVADLAGTVDRLRQAGIHLRSDPITGVGGNQVVIDDPSGNPVELFEPTRTEARLTDR
jgi:catechol 2,3-dioxygenase-like lactoylglutathione lyase family enzyme